MRRAAMRFASSVAPPVVFVADIDETARSTHLPMRPAAAGKTCEVPVCYITLLPQLGKPPR